MTFMIDGVKFTTDIPDMTREEAANYVEHVSTRVAAPVKEITVKLCDDGKVDVSYFAQVTFQTGKFLGKCWHGTASEIQRRQISFAGIGPKALPAATHRL